jgi:ABC-type transporter Mla subunit MlaD
MKPLRDFGFGKTSVWEGGVGIFVLAGAALTYMTVQWAKGNVWGRKGQPYQAVVEFPLACGVSVGTPVRIRGVQVGSVMNVRPSLERVDVLVEIRDQSTAIPRNSIVEANQSGLVSEPLVDITPQLPIPTYSKGPLDPDCEREGAIVCHRGRIVGRPGVSLDDLVYITTKLARQMDNDGMDKVRGVSES